MGVGNYGQFINWAYRDEAKPMTATGLSLLMQQWRQQAAPLWGHAAMQVGKKLEDYYYRKMLDVLSCGIDLNVFHLPKKEEEKMGWFKKLVRRWLGLSGVAQDVDYQKDRVTAWIGKTQELERKLYELESRSEFPVTKLRFDWYAPMGLHLKTAQKNVAVPKVLGLLLNHLGLGVRVREAGEVTLEAVLQDKVCGPEPPPAKPKRKRRASTARAKRRK